MRDDDEYAQRVQSSACASTRAQCSEVNGNEQTRTMRVRNACCGAFDQSGAQCDSRSTNDNGQMSYVLGEEVDG